MTDSREDKLPKWARDELFRLRQQVGELRRENETLKGEPGREEDCRGFYLEDYREGGYVWTPINLKGHWLVFRAGGSRLTFRPSTEEGKTYLEVMGDHGLVVRPRASNVVTVRGDD